MKRTRTFTLILICLSIAAIGLVPAGHAVASNDQAANDQTTIEDVKKETSDLMETLKAYSADKRDEALKKSKAAMDNLDDRIDSLEAQVDDSWDDMNTAVREKARASLKALRKERTKVAEWYGGMKASSAGAWEEMKIGFSNAYSDLAKAWEKAEKEYGPEKDTTEKEQKNS